MRRGDAGGGAPGMMNGAALGDVLGAARGVMDGAMGGNRTMRGAMFLHRFTRSF